MLYFKCPSCSTTLAGIQIIYEKIIDEICQQLEVKKITENEAENLKIELNNAFDIKYCCKTRLMTYTQDIKYIN
jgi:actin-like ATPase involved in cell morphogenesis